MGGTVLSAHPFSLWRLFGVELHHQLLLKWMILTGVAGFAFLIAVRYGLVAKVFESVGRVERWARYATGGIFLTAGLYFTLAYTIDVF